MSAASALPASQKAAVYERTNGPIELRDLPVPSPGPNDLLVRMLFTGVCHSDLTIHAGCLEGPLKLPLVGGHEGVGQVVSWGANVTQFEQGDKVGLKWINSTCMNCEFCRAGHEPSCEAPLLTGFLRDGTWQQFALVSAAHAIRIPEGVPLPQATPILCAGLTVVRALRVSGLTPGQTVAITGAGGGLGSLAIQYAKAMGLRVLALEAAAKRAFCTDLGADLFLDPFSSPDLVGEVRQLTEGGPHGVLSLAGALPAMDASVQYVRARGTVVLVGIPRQGCLQLEVTPAILRAVTVRCSYVGNRQDADLALEFVARGAVRVPVSVRPFGQLQQTLDELRQGLVQGRVVLDLWR